MTGEQRVEALIEELGRERGLTLVFVRTKRGVDRLVKRLAAHGIPALAMHGNKSQRQREQALARFQAGSVTTLIATDVAARGIDVTGISHVINFDPPADSEAYVHRIGRTGRAGHTGIGITLVSAAERREISQLAGQLGLRPSPRRRPRAADARRAASTRPASAAQGPFLVGEEGSRPAVIALSQLSYTALTGLRVGAATLGVR